MDQEKSLELNWFGLGALQVRYRQGGVRRAHPIQKKIFLRLLQLFESLGQPIHPSNPKCSHFMKEFSELLGQSPNSLAWQVMYNADPEEVAKSFAEDR